MKDRSTFFALLAAIMFAAFSEAAAAATNSFNEKTIKQWSLKGPLTNCPVRKSEALPLSDQENKSGWIRLDDVWDEFDGAALDTNKWTVGMAWWQGRQPAWFSPRNVEVRGGQLRLTMRKEPVPEQLRQR